MATIKNPWVNYITRSYKDVKNSVIARIKTECPEITDLSDSNILIIIISIFSGITEMLNYYIDNMARESFIGTARRLSSMLRIVKLINYKVKARIPASSDITISLVDSNGDPVETQSDIYVPLGTRFSSTNGLTYISTEDKTIATGETGTTIKVKQMTLVENLPLGVSSGNTFQSFSLPIEYAHGSCVITIDGQVWTYREFLDASNPTDQHYTISTDIAGAIVLSFGDGVTGAIPESNQTIFLTYYQTSGISGNLPLDSITTILDTLTIPNQSPAISDYLVNNNTTASGGQGIEGLEVIRKLAPLSLRTLNRAVTRQDYIDIAKLAPGVDKASLYFECGKHVEIYIAPMGGGVASTQLCGDTKDFIDEKKMITTFISVLPTGETYIGLALNITGKFRVPSALIQTDVQGALLDAYDYDSSDVNKPIRTSDIIALIDNLDKVDYLTLTEIYQIPYARPRTQGQAELVWDRRVLRGAVESSTWKLVFVEESTYANSYFKVYRNNLWKKNLVFGSWYDPTDSANTEVNFKFLALDNPALTGGLSWTFKVYPHNMDIELDDYSVPVMRLQDITMTITEQNYIR